MSACRRSSTQPSSASRSPSPKATRRRSPGVNLDCVQIFLRRGQPAPQGCSVYFVISDADALYAWHRSNGVEVAQPPDDRPYGLRDYTVRDRDGYYLTFGHRLRDE